MNKAIRIIKLIQFLLKDFIMTKFTSQQHSALVRWVHLNYYAPQKLKPNLFSNTWVETKKVIAAPFEFWTSLTLTKKKWIKNLQLQPKEGRDLKCQTTEIMKKWKEFSVLVNQIQLWKAVMLLEIIIRFGKRLRINKCNLNKD